MTEFEKRSGETKIVLLDLEYGDSGDYIHLCTIPHSNNPIVIDDIQYLPELISVSSISHSVEAIEGGGQVATCSIAIQNITGEYYSFRDTHKTKNRIAKIWIAFESNLAGKEPVFNGRVQSDDIDDEEWRITLEDTFGKYDQTLPKNLYDTETYTNLEEGAAGIPIPYAFGEVKKAVAVEIDTVTHKFKVSDLAIKQFDGIYLSNGVEEKKRENAFKVQYTGAETTALMHISDGNRLTVITTGNVDNLDYDLTNASYDTLTELVAAIDGEANFTCTLDADGDTNSIGLREIYDVDIKTAVTQIELAGNIYADVTSECSLDIANGEFTMSLNAFDIEYTGDAAVALLNISESGRLRVITTGNVDNLDIDLTDIRYRTMKKLVDEIHGTLNYTCTIDTADDAQSIMLKPIFNVDIKTASTQINLAAPEKGTVVVDFLGVKDDGAGLYTGTADALIERPCDIVHYIMRSVCGMDGTEIDTTSFANARNGIWGGFEFRRYITDLISSFELISQISTESYAWCYVDNLTGKLTWENKKGDDSEVIDNYYYESGQFPRIEANTLNKQASIRDLWNKIDINYGYIHDQGKFAKTGKFENTHSQSETTGYGTTNTYKKDCYWIPEDIIIGSIQYTGSGTCKLTISGSDDDEQIRFQTEITGGSGEPEHDLDLEGSAQDILSELQQIVDSDILYSHYIFILSSKYDTLESIGLSDVTDLTIDTEQDLTFSFAKLLGLKLKRRYSILLDTVQFDTSLFGFKQSLAKPIAVKSIKEGSDKRFRILATDGNPDDFNVAITAEYEPLCSCFNTCYGYSACTCDQECYSHQACVSCDDACYEETSGCTCDSSCYLYSACTCDNTCYEEGTSCSCNNTCYEYSGCSCDYTCYGESCFCDSRCYDEGCTCNVTCYNEQNCYCDDACYGYWVGGCTCDRTCYLEDYCTCQQTCYEETCWCDAKCFGDHCTCNNVCYAYSGCSCNQTCYGYVACECDQTCYLYSACQSCDNTCYEEASGCTCDSMCYQYLCTCDSMCYNEEQPCSCDYTTYA